MNIRRILLRTMLGCLAVAAAVGALAVLMMRTETAWRIVGTMLITAVAAGLLLPISLLTDKPRTRPAGLVAVALVFVEFLLSLLLVWDPLPSLWYGGWDTWGRLLATAFLLAGVVLPAIGFTFWIGGKETRWAGISGVGVAAAVFLLVVTAIWAPGTFGPDYWADHIGETGVALAIFGPMAIFCLIGAGSGDGRWWRWIGIAAAALALAIAIWGIWFEHGHHEGVYSVIVSIAALIAYANVAMRASLKPGQLRVRWVALAAATVTAACIDTQFILDHPDFRDLLDRFAAASGIIVGCSTLALAILAALNRRLTPAPVAIGEIHEISVVCPMCKKKQSIHTGGAACSECGLRIVVQLEEPHCATCGYLLFGLKSDRCPECGTPLAGGSRVEEIEDRR